MRTTQTQHLDVSDSDSPGAVVTIEKLGNNMMKAYTAVANAAGVTLTALSMLNGVIFRSGAVTVSDTLPTAAQLVAAFPGVRIGDTFETEIVNTNTGTLTILTGAGVTLQGTTAVATVATRRYQGRFTAVAVGSEAVTFLGLSTALN